MSIPANRLRLGGALFCFTIGCLASAHNGHAQVERKDINILKATDQPIVSYLKA